MRSARRRSQPGGRTGIVTYPEARLRPTVFGAVDGLVTNASLIAGLGGGGASPHAVILTGVAALVAGAFSMGTGEYVSVTNQNELVHAEVATERTMHARFPAAEQAELADTFAGYGADPETAARMAAAVSRDPDTALRVHTREELGVDPFELPSALAAGSLSLVAFSAGALIPLLPYLAGLSVLAAALGVAAVALMAGGMVVGRIDRPPDAALGPAPARPGRGRRRGDVYRGQPNRRPRRLTSRATAGSSAASPGYRRPIPAEPEVNWTARPHVISVGRSFAL